MEYVLLLGRILYSVIFIMSGPGHFTNDKIKYGAGKGVPLAQVFVPLSGIVAILGGLSILVGYKARYGAWLIVIFLIPVSMMMHDFWNERDPMTKQMQQINFMKNVSMVGAALFIAYFGSGPLSLG